MTQRVQPGGNVPKGAHLSDATSSSVAAAAPTLRQLMRDFEEPKDQKRLTANWKMVAGVIAGVLVGVAVLSLVLLAVAGTHGGAVCLLAILHQKAFAGIAAAHTFLAAHTAVASSAFLTKVITLAIPVAVLLGGGGAVGKLLRSEEAKAIDQLIPKTTEAIRLLEEAALGTNQTLPEDDIQRQIDRERGSILSSKVGTEFIAAKRQEGLHYMAANREEGLYDKVLSWGAKAVKAFGRFWSIVPYTTVKSVAGAPAHYKRVLENYDRELALKTDSATTQQRGIDALNELNQLRTEQLNQVVWGTDVMGDIYSKAPELIAYDRALAKLQLLSKHQPSEQDKKVIEETINALQESDTGFNSEKTSQAISKLQRSLNLPELVKQEMATVQGIKQQLIDKRLDPNSLESQKFQGPSGGVVRSLLTIKEDIWELDWEGVVTDHAKEELRGQILEAVVIYLNQHPEATATQVNQFVKNMHEGLQTFVNRPDILLTGTIYPRRQEVIPYHRLRAEVIRCALSNDKMKTPDQWRASFDKNSWEPMAQSRSSLVAAVVGSMVADIASAGIHATPVPLSSLVAGAVTTAAVGAQKGKFSRHSTSETTQQDQRIVSATNGVMRRNRSLS